MFLVWVLFICCFFFFSRKWFSSNNLNPVAPEIQQTDTEFAMDQIIFTIIAKFLYTRHTESSFLTITTGSPT